MLNIPTYFVMLFNASIEDYTVSRRLKACNTFISIKQFIEYKRSKKNPAEKNPHNKLYMLLIFISLKIMCLESFQNVFENSNFWTFIEILSSLYELAKNQ